jgi:hypothetical protein
LFLLFFVSRQIKKDEIIVSMNYEKQVFKNVCDWKTFTIGQRMETKLLTDNNSDSNSRQPNKTALEEALEVCKAVMKVSPENIANAPKKPREDDIIDR